MCDKAVNTYNSTIQFVHDCYKTQEMCDKAGNKCFLALIHIPGRYKTQQMRDRIISEDPVSIFYCPDKYNTQRMCSEVVDKCLAALKFIPDWFGTSKMLEKLGNALHANEVMLFYNEDFNKVSVIACQRYIRAADLKSIVIMIIIFMKMILIL